MPNSADVLANPILNGPYDPPSRYFELGETGPTGAIIDGRRPSESFIPIPPTKKRGKAKTAAAHGQLELDLTHEVVEPNTFIDALRGDVARWRTAGYPSVTTTSKRLLEHWADPTRENRILFAQREAAETAIYLAEVATRQSALRSRDWRAQLADFNHDNNLDLPRVAFKMATGSGKTVVMAMLIAWQTLNKVAHAGDPRFSRRFLLVAPGITIRDRLRVLQPNDRENYYDQRGIVPAGLRAQLGKAQILVVNYHAFLLRDSKEIQGVSSATRRILTHGKAEDPFKETEQAMVSRVLRDWGVGGGRRQSDVIVINDEAHHCYANRPIDPGALESGALEGDKEDLQRNLDARVWFKGIQAIAEHVGVKQVYDLSATPFYLKGSGYREGFIFPWTVSDFSLMDAIESGIVKVPRIPVDDDAEGDEVTYLNLWDKIGRLLPKRGRKDGQQVDLPPELEGALQSLYRSYLTSYEHWRAELAPLDEPPPVFIVICPNTTVSKMVFDWVAGREGDFNSGVSVSAGNLALFSNFPDGQSLAKPNTILVDSAQLESGEAMSADFKQAANVEIAAFKADYRLRNPGADVDALTDEDLLREVLNTVGKRGRLGEHVRCVVSVSMLTEGWDANTVTHILGVRAFGSQLLCEQVVGRGLRRRSYVIGDDGKFTPEYANVYGVPFAFIPTDAPVVDAKPPQPATHVRAVVGREHLRIEFPNVEGYRLEVADGHLGLAPDLEPYVVSRETIPTWTDASGVVGESEVVRDDIPTVRPQQLAYGIARRLAHHHFAIDPTRVDAEGDIAGVTDRPWLFPQLVDISRRWVARAVSFQDGLHLGHLAAYSTRVARAADRVFEAISQFQSARTQRLLPILRQHDATGSTGGVSFQTRKTAIRAKPDRSEVSHVVLDGVAGNTWEQLVMTFCEDPDRPVAAYVKNDHLGFAIPYVHEGRTHRYVPDFLIRLPQRDEGDPVRTLIVEVSGGQKSSHAPGPTWVKATTARDSWCTAVNNHGGFGVWGYVELTDPPTMADRLLEAIDNLYAGRPITGDPDLIDLAKVL